MGFLTTKEAKRRAARWSPYLAVFSFLSAAVSAIASLVMAITSHSPPLWFFLVPAGSILCVVYASLRWLHRDSAVVDMLSSKEGRELLDHGDRLTTLLPELRDLTPTLNLLDLGRKRWHEEHPHERKRSSNIYIGSSVQFLIEVSVKAGEELGRKQQAYLEKIRKQQSGWSDATDDADSGPISA